MSKFVYRKPSINRTCISWILDKPDSIYSPDYFHLNRMAVIYAAGIQFSFLLNQPPTHTHGVSVYIVLLY